MKRGVALIWTLVLSSILLIVSGSMASFIIKESRFTVQIEESTIAYSAAKTGVEWGKVQVKNNTVPDVTKRLNINDATVDVYIDREFVSGKTRYTRINSTSEKNGVKRKIEYPITDRILGTVISPSTTITPLGTNTDSFTLIFDFWGTGFSDKEFGLSSSSGVGKIIIQPSLTNGTLELSATGTTEKFISPRITLNGTTNNYAQFHVEVRYIKDTAASIKISKRNTPAAGDSTSTYACIGSGSISLSGINLGDLNQLYFENSSFISSGNFGDGTYVQSGNYYLDTFFLSK